MNEILISSLDKLECIDMFCYLIGTGAGQKKHYIMDRQYLPCDIFLNSYVIVYLVCNYFLF